MYFISSLLTKKIKHGISTVDDGNMAFGLGPAEEVKKHRRNFLNNLQIPSERSVFLQVQHGTKIIHATQSLAGTGFGSKETAIKADALTTFEKGLALVVLTADCIPLFIHSEKNSFVTIAHISRHNLGLAFPQILITNLKREYGILPNELSIYLGPSIKKESYLLPQFPKGFDIVGECQSQLLLKGVKRENIIIDKNDTAINPEFFSHYRDVRSKVPEGRFATVLMLT